MTSSPQMDFITPFAVPHPVASPHLCSPPATLASPTPPSPIPQKHKNSDGQIIIWKMQSLSYKNVPYVFQTFSL